MRVKKRWQHKEVLQNMYEDQGLPIRTIADILETTPNNILYWMRKFDIESRKFEIGDLNKGKKLSDEERQHLSDIAKNRFKDPTNHPMYGKKHTEAARLQMSETKRKKREQRQKEKELECLLDG